MPATQTIERGTTAATPSQTPRQDGPARHVHMAIVGSGFAGLGMAIRLKQQGIEDFLVLERADDVGGTWRDNHYPGCQCDVPSHLYSFSFAPNPTWSRTFSRQPEIQAYLRRCAEDAGVMPHVRFGHAVTGAAWDENAQLWRIDTAGGPFTARMLVAAPGPLSEPSVPSIPGIGRFEGKVFHSAQWDHDHDLDGERVAVIGTGASAIQFVPRIQPRVGRLHLFQRTPAWIMPHPDRPISRLERRVYRAFPAAQRLMRAGIYWARETFVFGFLHRRLMRMPQRIARHHLRSQVADPQLRAKLTPDYQIGCKRILMSNDFYPSLCEPNVEVVTDGVREVRESSIVDAAGVEREVDTIIFGTGFQVAKMPIAERVRGRDGLLLADAWRDGMQAHLGTTVAGFPNLFIVPGPEHRPRPHLDGVHDRVADRLRAGLHARDAAARRGRGGRAARGPGRLQRRGPAGHGGHGLAVGLRQLVPRRVGPQPHALAGLHVRLPPAHEPLRPGAVRAARGGPGAGPRLADAGPLARIMAHFTRIDPGDPMMGGSVLLDALGQAPAGCI